jgi:hypothetical protein
VTEECRINQIQHDYLARVTALPVKRNNLFEAARRGSPAEAINGMLLFGVGVPFLGDAGVLVNAHRARDPQQRLTRDGSQGGCQPSAALRQSRAQRNADKPSFSWPLIALRCAADSGPRSLVRERTGYLSAGHAAAICDCPPPKGEEQAARQIKLVTQ